jgi:hypothetical protein
VLNPWWLRDPVLSWRITAGFADTVTRGAWLPAHGEVPGPLAYHTTRSLTLGCGLAAALRALPALGWGLVTGGAARLLAVEAIGLIALLFASRMVLARYFLPVLPPLAATWIDAHLPPDAVIVSWGAPALRYDFGSPAVGGRHLAKALDPALWTAVKLTHVVWHRYPLPYDAPPVR